VGYFSCWLAHLAKGRPLRGLMLDANPQAVEEAAWHAQANGWSDVQAINGILGEGEPGQSTEFYLYESNIWSTSQLPDVEAMGLKGKWQKIEVPCLRLEDEWRRRFDDARCDLLKVDIEGSELNFLQTESKFLERVSVVLIEWHKWRVDLKDIQSLLESAGFRFVKTLEENDQMGTACFERRG
jgi:FkbM family methyltransferase